MTSREKRHELGKEIIRLKGLLDNSDYKQSKFVDGAMTEEEYAPIRDQRQAWRDEINALEAEIEATYTETM